MSESKYKLKDRVFYRTGAGKSSCAEVIAIIERDCGFSYDLHDLNHEGKYANSWEKGKQEPLLFPTRIACIDGEIAQVMRKAVQDIQALENAKTVGKPV